MPEGDYDYASESRSFHIIGRFADPIAFGFFWSVCVELAVYQNTNEHTWNYPDAWQLYLCGMVFAMLWLIVPGTWLGELAARQFRVEPHARHAKKTTPQQPLQATVGVPCLPSQRPSSDR